MPLPLFYRTFYVNFFINNNSYQLYVGNELRARGGKIEQITISRHETVNVRLKFLLPKCLEEK